MLEEGAFTHILHPNIENLFEGAYIDVIVFRYCKDKSLYGSNILFNDEEKRVVAVEGILTFEPLNQGEPEFLRGTDTCGGASDRVDFHNTETLDQYFDIFVGMVTGEILFSKILLIKLNERFLNSYGELNRPYQSPAGTAPCFR